MQILKYISISAYLFFCAISNLTAQQYPFVHYTPKDGLVNSRVRRAYQDSKGRMYFMTFGGLSMYDGARFKNYTLQNGLLSNLVNDVLEVGEDSLLVAVNTCGLNMLVRGHVKKMNVAADSCAIINQLLKSSDGTIYATADDGLYRIKQNRFEKLPAFISPQKDPAIYLGLIAEYKDFLIFTTNDLRRYTGLYLYNKKTNAVTDILPQLKVFSLKCDRTGMVWISTPYQMMNLDTTALTGGKLVLVKPYASFIKPATVRHGNIVFNFHNEPFISAGSNGVTRYMKDGTTLHIGSPEPSDFGAENFFIDSEDVLWVCHDGNGVYKLPDTKLQWVKSFFEGNKSGVRAVKADNPDSCWLLMNNGQVILHSSSASKIFSIPHSINAYALHTNNKQLYIADYHKLYIASMPGKLETKIRLKQILTIPDSSSFGGRFVNDPYGNVIFFEMRSIGVLHNEKLLFTYPSSSYDLIEGMYVNSNKELCVVSRSQGLQIFSLHPENPANYLIKKAGFVKEFEHASARCITVDKNGILWVGTRYDGLMGFEYKNNQLTKKYHFQTQNGLTDNFITSLACDKNDNILIGTQTGLDRLLKSKDNIYRIENVTKGNNIFSYINNLWADADNNAFAFTNAGLVYKVEPAKATAVRYQPQLLIEEIRVNGKAMPDYNTPLQLQHLQRNITISLAAPAFLDEKQVKFSYLLSGSGIKEWSDTSVVADINLLNLSPGKYTLQAKAFFLSTPYVSKQIEFSFVILPPWWQTWWFRLLIGLFTLALLILFIRTYYRRKLEKQKNLLEKQQIVEKERTRIAADIHDDLGAGLSTIRFLSEKVKRNSFSDVTKIDAEKIVTNSNELVQKMNELIWAMNEKNDTLEDLLFYTRSYAAEYAEENNLQFNMNLPESIPGIIISGEVRRNVFLTVKEALHNIVKHAQAKSISIVVSINKSLLIILNDDGIGFAENAKGNGNGLRNMQKRILSVGGSLEIINANGVEVKIAVPLF
jgi:signal transduction histidine kinase/ligand-binding sensor domain-containing protein